ncbi:hypothetical protein PanWU01x14_174440 [Parasponia andersonii]|uniref:Uncharacterized protein n=1 Tax=Parasponia andersonii TaxID=3476 RepID=A0A2P5C8G5_PARAD|nr:hypothetical protein PanWU01x14_174440 [Parasponia andersonii]
MARENARGGSGCAVKCLSADLSKDRAMGITSRNKMIADGPRKCKEGIEMRNKTFVSGPR